MCAFLEIPSGISMKLKQAVDEGSLCRAFLLQEFGDLELVDAAVTGSPPFVTHEKAADRAIEDQRLPIFVAGLRAACAPVKLSLDDSHARSLKHYGWSSTSVSGRSPPAAVSMCHLPSDVSYSIASVRPGTRCSAAARLAAASAAAWVAKASENTPSTV